VRKSQKDGVTPGKSGEIDDFCISISLRHASAQRVSAGVSAFSEFPNFFGNKMQFAYASRQTTINNS
jgi:hypothetical protein